MVLSNKKLKQKLRQELSQSLISSESKPSANITLPSSTNSQSLNQLLGAAAHKPRLSKREKRRLNAPLDIPSSSTEIKDGEDDNMGQPNNLKRNRVDGGNAEVRVEIKKKKRKRGKGDNKMDLKKGSDLKKEEKKDEMKINNQKDEPGEVSEIATATKGGQIGVQKDEISDGQVNETFPKKVYVGGIPYYSSEDDIRSFFDHCGTITEVDCLKFPETGKFRGIAILSFKTEEAAKRAISLDGSDMGEFFLKIQPYNKKTPQVSKTPAFTPPVIQGYNRIYAGNLSWNITEDDLKIFFSDCSISSIRFGEDKVTGEFKGYAHVDFSDNTSLEKALKLDQEIVCGRPVRITRAVALRNPQSMSASKQSASQGGIDNNGAVSTGTEDNEQSATQGNAAVSTGTEDNKQSTTQDNAAVSTVSTGKMRRRNCYLCGERGHMSSACPKQAA